jgi:LPS-assembly lipoprotein
MQQSRKPHTQDRGNSFMHGFSSLMLLTAALLLTACGFQLRGQAALPFDSMFISGPPLFVTQLSRAVRAGTRTQIAANPKDADVTLQILAEARDRAILSLSGSGRVRELQIRYRVTYRLYDKDNKELLAPSEILLRRDLTYSDTDVLGKEQEEALLYRDMQNDAVQQLVRRLEAVPTTAPAPKEAPA